MPPRLRGYLVILVTLVITYALWLGGMAREGSWYDDRFKYAAKVGSMSATLLMCWAFLLSTRLRPVERLFGGLDKVYRAHRHVGEAAFAVIFLHPIFLAFHRLPDWADFGRFFWFSSDAVRNTGIVALLLLVVLVLLSLRQPLRYHFWKHTHHFFGAVLVLVVVHGIMAGGEIMRLPALRLWFAVWITAALVSYAYIRFFYRYIGPTHDYRVAVARPLHTITEIELEPTCRPLLHHPGQFLYITFDTPELGPEPHPFSIASAPSAPRLRLAAKNLGDWTALLPRLRPGDPARITGPYGFFGYKLAVHPEWPAVLIAGGIGVTPFVSMVEEDAFLSRRHTPTHLIHSVEDDRDAYRSEALAALSARRDDFHYHPHRSDREGYLDLKALADRVGEIGPQCFLICGPAPMMRSLTAQLRDAGIPPERIISEDFSIV